SWRARADVLFYDFVLQTEAGETVLERELTEPELRLNLGPGEYRYRIVPHNLLGKPEGDQVWRRLRVLKAEAPRVTGLSGKTWFLEDLEPRLRLSGDELMPGARVELIPPSSARPIEGRETGRQANSELSVDFPAEGLSVGEYALMVTNPGGLSFRLPGAILVRYQRPVELSLSFGLAPWLALYDSAYKEAWPGTFFPLGSASRLDFYFFRRPYGQFGIEVALGGRLMEGGSPTATIVSQIGLVGGNCLYKYSFSRLLSMAARAGVGLSLSHHAFDYSGSKGQELSSIDPYLSAGLSLQCSLSKRYFLEAGADWMQISAAGITAGGLMPFLSAGMLLF
ncbi:MAG TPA: hypothetical protein VFL04_06615, partial [Rectinemataceae bacterium]|nr:hypothetical protein [Rectinemataceae bacterium]